MSTPTDESELQIGDDIMQELSLDRTIQQIQRHKKVFSTRLHPLLCAFTSAETVAYQEQSAGGGTSIVSGKFRSMLIDIFGRTYPEKTYFTVDRDAVARYKKRVHGNVATVSARLDALLRSVATPLPV
jgi:hypothetical protein